MSSRLAPSIVRFPERHAACVWITHDGPVWLVRAYEHGWLHTSSGAADTEATWLSENYGLPVRAVMSTSS